ncbi:hypothetical protein E2C01_050960 [Portunus trituberculatus]|uniref:Uncharacterized protein n=1 Tax=Portunus trituberculatus TaxID=210409 RepID=A0A5B7GDH4_PORTR|nr:hypothetical protein [Portunus trituberculatus]
MIHFTHGHPGQGQDVELSGASKRHRRVSITLASSSRTPCLMAPRLSQSYIQKLFALSLRFFKGTEMIGGFSRLFSL